MGLRSPAFTVDPGGLIAGIPFIPSPNCDPRPSGAAVRLLVIHNISLPPGEFGGDGVIRLFTNRLEPHAHPCYRTLRDLKVSAHFLIRRGGQMVQFVPCQLRAWHAGVSSWRGVPACNDFSIGIELEGTDSLGFTVRQYRALNRLTRALRAAYPLEDIVGHSDIAPGRKTDPGPRFDWARYSAARGCCFRLACGPEKRGTAG